MTASQKRQPHYHLGSGTEKSRLVCQFRSSLRAYAKTKYATLTTRHRPRPNATHFMYFSALRSCHVRSSQIAATLSRTHEPAPLPTLPHDKVTQTLAELFEEHGYGRGQGHMQHSSSFLAEYWMATICNGAAVHESYSGEDIGQALYVYSAGYTLNVALVQRTIMSTSVTLRTAISCAGHVTPAGHTYLQFTLAPLSIFLRSSVFLEEK